MITNYDNIVFDLGGVVINIDRDRCVRNLEALGLDNAARLLDLYKQSGDFLSLEEGKMSAGQFFDILRNSSSRQVTDAELEEAICSFIVDLPLSRLKAIRELRKTKKVYVLSNTNPIMYPTIINRLFRQEGLTINDYFDGILLSYVEKVCKPSPKIFATLLRRYNLEGTRTLFLDDSEANCHASRECGINAACVPPGTEFIEILKNLR